MNRNIIDMIKKNILFGGKIIKENGFTTFQRLSIEEIINTPLEELAFATGSMGRAIFTIGENGGITNIKGVDSHLQNDEISPSHLVQAESVYIPNPNKSYGESTYPINLIIFPGNKVDIRIRGASPLEDLEIEADVNSKLGKMGVKVPKIESVKEFPSDVAEKLGLPIKIKGSYDEFTSSYSKEDTERKQYLHTLYGENYSEEITEELRPEKMVEYLQRKGVMDSEQFTEFAKQHNFEVGDFAQYVDSSYQLGQRYGQTDRKMNNPFRISDIEYYIRTQDIEALNSIMDFSQEINNDKYSVEENFAKQMGKNIGLMMSNGWCCENFVHRQDYTLAGEICDDSYFDLCEYLKETEKTNENDIGKFKAIKEDHTRKFFTQVFLIGSNIKVLQDEMQMRGKSEKEIDQLLELYSESFIENFDITALAEKFEVKQDEIVQYFDNLVNTPQNYAEVMASESRRDGIIKDEAVLLAHNGFNDFYNKLSKTISERIQKRDKVLESAVQATEETTRISTINEQVQGIKYVSKYKTKGNEKQQSKE